MAKIKHINCGKCGGTLGMAGVDRVIQCRYCGVWSLVDFGEQVPEYFVKPKIAENDARRTITSLLRDPEMPKTLIKQARFHSARLYFIPFHELTGRRLGTMTMTEFKRVGPRRMVDDVYVGPGGQTMTIRKEDRSSTPMEKKVDTRVIMSDITRLEPALSLKEWGLEESDISAIRSDPAGMLQPMDRREMERRGKIYEASVKPDQMIASVLVKSGTAWLQDNTEVGEVRVKRVYYPVWRVRYSYQGRLYGASIDGVTGKVMAARAPQDDRFRIYWLLGTSAAVSFIVGRLARALVGSIVLEPENMGLLIEIMARGATVIIPVALIGILLALTFMGLGWEQFRYPAEVVIAGNNRTAEKINRPEHTTFDFLSSLTEKVLDNMVSVAKSRRSF
jgi:hypothetical protein